MSGHWLIPDRSPEKIPHYEEQVRIYRARLAVSGFASNAAFAKGQLGLIEAMYPFDTALGNLRLIASIPDRELRALAPLLADEALARSMLVLVIADSID